MKGLSLIILTYNNHNYIRECLNSIIPELLDSDQLILLDDKSDYPIHEFVEDLVLDLPCEIVFKYLDRNIGTVNALYSVRNDISKDLVKILSGDDYFLRGWRGKIASISQTNTNKTAFFGPVTTKNGIVHPNPKFIANNNLNSFLCNKGAILAPSVILTKASFEFLNLKFKIMEDKPWWINLFLAHYKFRRYEDPIVFYRLHDKSVQRTGGIPSKLYLMDRIRYYKLARIHLKSITSRIILSIKIFIVLNLIQAKSNYSKSRVMLFFYRRL